jgi:protein-L-isoaspartate(D-aspartate) O-methyltransferase
MEEFLTSRHKMVEKQIGRRGVCDPRVLEAMRTVPRHLFVRESEIGQAYDDTPLPIGEKQTISQPYIVGYMTEALELKGFERVLEIGTGSGYQAAILAELAREVYTVERIPKLSESARKILDDLNYRNIHFKIDDGTLGWPEEAPFDGIIVTAASPDTPEPLIEQLSDGGRLVIPLGSASMQSLKKIIKQDKHTKTVDLGGCRFVKLIGEHGWHE